MNACVRTVLGDLDPSALHACDAHEHAWIGDSYATTAYPEFRIDDAPRVIEELRTLRTAGIDWLVDCMPGDAGRDLARLAEVSRASGVAIVASTGAHLAQYYPAGHALFAMGEAALADHFVDEIERGANGIRCGVIKVAGGRDRLTDAERRIFRAAAIAHRRTGCPIITHTEAGTAATGQVELLIDDGGCDALRVTLSHVDRIEDPDLHRTLLRRGVTLEYDGHFRWKGRDPNPTVELIATLLPEFPTQIVVGMDAARPAYWSSFGGSPGLAYLGTMLHTMLATRGVSEPSLTRLYVDNPRRAFSFTEARP